MFLPQAPKIMFLFGDFFIITLNSKTPDFGSADLWLKTVVLSLAYK
jgi:hypothetical protein